MSKLLNRNSILIRSIAMLVCICLTVVTMTHGSCNRAEAAGEKHVVGADGSMDPPIEYDYYGYMTGFGIGDGIDIPTINVNEPFSFELNVEEGVTISDTKRGTLYLLPYTDGDVGEAFAHGKKYTVTIGEPSLSYTSSEGNLVYFKGKDARVSFPIPFDAETESVDSLAPSGVYFLCCMIECLDVMDIYMGNTVATMIPGHLIRAYKPVRVNNPADGGYISDEAYGVDLEQYKSQPVKLDVTVSKGDTGEEIEGVETLVYDANKTQCFGYAPCSVIAGEQVALNIVPVGIDAELKYVYDFPNINSGDPYYVEVPDDGKVTVVVSRFESGASLSGKVLNKSGQPVAGAIVTTVFSTSGTVAKNAVTGADGSFVIEGIVLSDDVKLTVDAGGYYTKKDVIELWELRNGSVYKEYSLNESEPAFSIAIESDYDDELVSDFVDDFFENAKVSIDNPYVAGSIIYATPERRSASTIDYYLDFEENIAPSYQINYDSRYVSGSTQTVKHGEVLTLKAVSDITSYKMSAVIDIPSGVLDSYRAKISVDVYDESGVISYSETVPAGDYSKIIMHGSGTVVLSASISETVAYAKTIKEKREMATQYPDWVFIEFDNSNNGYYDAGDIHLKLTDLMSDSPFFVKSNIILPTVLTDSEKTFSVMGHIEAEVEGVYTVNGIRITGVPQGQSEYQYTCGYVQDTFAINGKKVAVNYDSVKGSAAYIMFEQPVKAPFDFSCRLMPYTNADIIVTADVLAGKEEDSEASEFLVGNYRIDGEKITVRCNPSATDERVLFSGSTSLGGEIYVYDGDNLIGQTMADAYGKWELYASLSPSATMGRTHFITARCEGETSRDVEVKFNPQGVSVKGVYLVNTTYNGSELDNPIREKETYSWDYRRGYAFEADVENSSHIVGTPRFEITCSDGTILSFAANARRNINGSADAVTYATDTVELGKHNLIPVRVEFSYHSDDAERSDAGTNVVYHSAAMNEAAGRDINIDLFDNVSVVNKFLTRDESSEIANVTLLEYETSPAELELLEKEGAKAISICDDFGRIIKKAYNLYTETGFICGYQDVQTGKCYISVYLVYDKDSYPDKLEEFAMKMAGENSKVRKVGWVDGEYNKLEVAKSSSLIIFYETLKTNSSKGLLQVIEYAEKFSKTAPSWLKKITNFGPEFLTAVGAGVDYINNITRFKNLDEMYVRLDEFQMITETVQDKLNMRRPQNSVIETKSSIARAGEELSSFVTTKINYAVASALAKLSTGGLGEIVVDAISSSGVPEAMTSAQTAYAEATYSGAMADFTDAFRELLKATRLTRDEYDMLLTGYYEGTYDKSYIRNYILAKFAGGTPQELFDVEPEDQDDPDGKPTIYDTTYSPIFDPSGYIYEGVASNRIEGAVVTLMNDAGEFFEADKYNQRNPLVSDGEGKYAWDVPEGNWLVTVYKEGYGLATSSNDPAATVVGRDKSGNEVHYLPVLPVQLDVNIGITSNEKPKASLSWRDGSWYIVFSKYVEAATVNSASVALEINAANVQKVTYVSVDDEVSPAHTPICGGKTLARTFRIDGAELNENSAFVVRIGSDVLGYNGLSAAGTISSGGTENSQDVTPGQNEVLSDSDRATEEPAKKENAILLIIIILLIAVAGGGAAFYLLIYRKKKQNY